MQHDEDVALYVAIVQTYQAYADCLDQGQLTQWPDFFTTQGVYRAQARENFDRGLPLAAMACQGRGMFEDRVTVISKVMVFAPRYIRHILGPPRVVSRTPDEIRSQASFCVYHTLPDSPTELLSVGRYEDRLSLENHEKLKFRERLAIYDSLLIPNSLVYPL
jgi:salicylate 5-hydroxylase small subunit